MPVTPVCCIITTPRQELHENSQPSIALYIVHVEITLSLGSTFMLLSVTSSRTRTERVADTN